VRVEAVPEWAFGPREAEVAALLAACFDVDFGGRTFFKQRHHLRLLLLDPGVVGHVAVTWRAVRLGSRLVDAAGLAEVATHPDRRGEGIARRLVERAVEEARASLASVVLLFGDAGLYGALGFRPAANPIRHVAMDRGRTLDVREERGDLLMALPLRGEPWDGEAPLDLLGPMF
jgi:GNAT superfamily N-acetyltransferase